MERYEELRGYVAVHGDTLVPGKYCSKMSSSPLEGVLRVGVDDVGDTTQCDEDEENHRRMGGVVPQNNPILGRWVNNQRVAYKIHTRKLEFDNKWKGIEDYLMDDETKEEMERLTRMPSDMTQERIRLLEAVDFVWDVHAHVWELRYRESRDYSARCGHTDVRARARRRGGGDDARGNDPLAHWVSTQRNYYAKHQNGQHTSLTEERIRMLDSIGFAWKVLPRAKGVKSQSQAKRAGARNS